MTEEATSGAAPANETEPVTPEAPTVAGPYAIIETGGKQYRVRTGDRISIEKLDVADGGNVVFDRVLMIGGEGDARIGAPVLDGASVTAIVDQTYRGEKLVIFKYKPKKRYRRRTGHRQTLTRVTIGAINA